MTRLTEQRIAETFNAYKPTWMGGWDFLGGDTADSMRGFARAIAALAVQEVEQERDGALNRLAQLHAQLAEARKERDFYRLDAERHAQFADSYRAQLSSDKREALVPCRECAGSGLVPATPSGAGKCPMPDDVCEQCGYRCATPSGESENDQALLDEVAGFEAMWEAREKAHDAEVATLTAQLAEARKERDAHREQSRINDEVALCYRRDWQQAKAQLATAKREALTQCADDADLGFSSCGKGIREWRDKHFPATPSGELCDADCGCPSPEAREVDSEFLLRVVQEVNAYAVITPADAKRIVAMARTGGTE